MDPFSVDDPAAREREQRRREREARRRAQLGQRVTEVETGSQPVQAEAPPEPEEQTERPAPPTREPAAASPPAEAATDDGKPPAGSSEDWSQASAPRQPPVPPDQPLPRRPRAKTIRRRRIIFGAIGIVVVLILAFLVLLFQPFHGSGHGRVAVRIPRGASASGIADLLDSKGVVSNSTLFRIRLDLDGSADQIQAGRYTLAYGMSYGDAIDALTHKATPLRTTTTTVTVPEGYDRVQIAALLKQDGIKGNYLDETKSFKGFNQE